jgi:hypothetical protein
MVNYLCALHLIQLEIIKFTWRHIKAAKEINTFLGGSHGTTKEMHP